MTPDRPERKNPRLRGWDYGAGGTYFVTICTKDQRHTLSSLAVGGDAHIAPQNRLTPLGLLAKRYLSSIPGVIKSVVMPNHVHFLVTLEGGPMWASAPTRTPEQRPVRVPVPSLAGVVRSYKTLVTKAWGMPVWQRGYYDHIVRSENDFLRIWTYIDNNPLRWELDRYYTER